MSAPFAPAAELETLTVGSLCSGYLGADAAIAALFNSVTIWAADSDPDVSKLLAQRYAGPNLGDLRTVDWTAVERPRLICAGFPCQDISPAGRRQGIAPHTRSGLWTWIAYVIETVKPDYVFIENSRGLTSAKAHSDVERCPWCMGDGAGQPDLRALGRVLGDLAERGFDAEWVVVRASDVGAPHERARAFIWAWRRGVADSGCWAFRGAPRIVAGTPGAAAVGAGLGWDGGAERERVWADDRDGRGGAADAAGVRGRSWGVAASGSAGGASGVLVGCGGAGADADAGTSRRGAEQRDVSAGGQPDVAGRRGGADADAESVGRAERRPERARLKRRSDDGRGSGETASPVRPAADADNEPSPGELRGAAAAALHRPQPADTSGAGLEVGAVEHHGPQRAPAQRDRRDGTADAESQRRQRRPVAGPEPSGLRRPAHSGEFAPDPDDQRWASGQREPVGTAVERTAASWRHEGDAPADFIWRVDDYDYTQAIKAWEAITGRPAPLPAVPNRRGDWRLNPRLSEWMMGLPDGWVTGVEGLSRAAQLRIIGNGLVPTQGALALDILTERALLD